MIQTIPVVVTRPDGGVSIVRVVTCGRGSVLPSGAHWLDEKNGLWSRKPTDAVVREEVARAVPGATAWRITDESLIPTDRTFRDALNPDMTHDIDKAREVVRRNLRHERGARFLELDAQWMRATGQGRQAEVAAIEKKRQALRDAPADPRIDAARNLEQLKAIGLPEA